MHTQLLQVGGPLFLRSPLALFAVVVGSRQLSVVVLVLVVLGAAAVVTVLLLVWLASQGRHSSAARPSSPTPPASAPAPTGLPGRACPQCGAAVAADAPQGLCPACLLKAGMAGGASADPSTRPMEPTAAEPPALEEIAKLLPQLEILELLGRGGMGVVYKARQPQLDRLVALKALSPTAARDPAFAERFTREARALAKLSHPNIVGVYDFGKAGDLFYFIMEYVDGTSLRQLERTGKLTPVEALAIVPKICDALQYAHDEGIVHRDIKPENILVDRKGRVKIADFGLAKLQGKAPEESTLTGSQQTMGTLHYMAPEQMYTPLAVDHRADIYSLGVVFYEMLTGELPLGKFAPPSQRVQVDVRLDEVVLHAMEMQPERRYQHVSEIKTDVEAIAQSGTGVPPVAARARLPGRKAEAAVPASGVAERSALNQVRGPAIALVVVAVLNWLGLFAAIPLVAYFAQRPGAIQEAVPPLLILILAAGTALILWGALKMRRLESLAKARMAAILAMVIGPGYLVGWPVGIWALVVLARPEVKAAFGGRGVPASPQATGTPTPSPGRAVGILSLVLAITGLVLPLLLGIGRAMLAGLLHPPDALFLLCIVLGIVLEVAALGSGIVGLRTRPGKAGLITSIVALALYVAVSLAVFVVVAGGVREGGRMVEGHGATEPAAPPLREFSTATDQPLSDSLTAVGDGWVADCAKPETLRLFEVPDPEVEDCTVVYRAKLNLEGLTGQAYLQMWCRLPGRGEFFSKGLPVTGAAGWLQVGAPFRLEPGQRPDLIRLNVVVEGTGRIGIKDVELLRGTAPDGPVYDERR